MALPEVASRQDQGCASAEEWQAIADLLRCLAVTAKRTEMQARRTSAEEVEVREVFSLNITDPRRLERVRETLEKPEPLTVEDWQYLAARSI